MRNIVWIVSLAISGCSASNELIVDSFEDGTQRIEVELESLDEKAFAFESTQEAEEIVRQILDTSQITPNYSVLASYQVSNAQAVFVSDATNFWKAKGFKNGDRLIVYNPIWIQDWIAKDKYMGIALIGHELGHHLNGHTLVPGKGSSPPIELEADRYAGCVVARLEGSEEDATRLFESFSEVATATHPGREDRVNAVLAGYHSCVSTPSPTVPSSGEACSLERMVGFWTCEGSPCTSGGDVSEILQQEDGSFAFVDGVGTKMPIYLEGDVLIRRSGSKTSKYPVEDCSKIFWNSDKHWSKKITAD